MALTLLSIEKFVRISSVKCFELIDQQEKEVAFRHNLNYIQSLKFTAKFDNDQLTVVFESKPSDPNNSNLILQFNLNLTLVFISKSIKPNSVKYPYNFPQVSMNLDSTKIFTLSLTYNDFKQIYNKYQKDVPTLMFQIILTKLEITPFVQTPKTKPKVSSSQTSTKPKSPAPPEDSQRKTPTNQSSTTHDDIQSNKSQPQNSESYVGLQNQGSTCYLNSALQTLFHIPSFRKLVYDIPPGESPFIGSLQCLFAKMQLCAEKSIPTFELTQSLGSNQDVNRQRDVQEFLSERFEALKTALQSNTSLHQRMMNLFYGEYEQSIRATNIDYQQSTTQQFREITLTVKGNNSLAESLQQYISEERLTGDNQYDIPNHGKQDVILQKMFLQFPPVLFLHLSRFEHDSQTNQMKKINSRMEFPKTIDLQPYLKENLQTQEYNYDLHGVIVHSGTPISGHYYAYLRPSTSPQWYQFNDMYVNKVDEREAIENNYGGGSTMPPYGENTSSAYMLLYVKRSNENSIYESIPNDSIPSQSHK